MSAGNDSAVDDDEAPPSADSEMERAAARLKAEAIRRVAFRRGELVVDGRYRIVGPLGEGGWGTVYEAEDTTSRLGVALKLVQAETEAQRRAFVREAQAVARLTHPNIVHLKTCGEWQGTAYLAFELVKGHEPVAKTPLPMEPAKAADLAALVADALAYAHDDGIVHRDLSHNNVLIGPKGAVKIIDFGLSLFVESTAADPTGWSRVRAGTPGFMAPEQLAGLARQTNKVDVWAAGALLFEMLTGRLPFGSARDTAQMREPLDLSGVPGRFHGILQAALARDPEQRCTARELAESLARLSDSSEALTDGMRGIRIVEGRPSTDVRTELEALLMRADERVCEILKDPATLPVWLEAERRDGPLAGERIWRAFHRFAEQYLRPQDVDFVADVEAFFAHHVRMLDEPGIDIRAVWAGWLGDRWPRNAAGDHEKRTGIEGWMPVEEAGAAAPARLQKALCGDISSVTFNEKTGSVYVYAGQWIHRIDPKELCLLRARP